ncbi:MAG: hypothetical protein KDE31_26275, partial [Caldilineaceae bacterium]|nr:hypothetical protein [Caldilineaceae bacterium]
TLGGLRRTLNWSYSVNSQKRDAPEDLPPEDLPPEDLPKIAFYTGILVKLVFISRFHQVGSV